MTMKRMFGMLTTSKWMKVISIITVASMLLTLTTCGGTASQQDAGMVTEENSTIERVTEIPNEPGYDIAPGADIPETSTEEPSSTEESPSDNGTVENPPTGGAYTYTVYGDIQLSMDVNVDDYIWTNSSGKEVFGFIDMALALGWWPGTGGGIPIDPTTFGGTREGWASNYDYLPGEFFYPVGDSYIYFVMEGLDEADSRYDQKQLGWLEVKNSDNTSLMLFAYFGNHYDDTQYIVPFRSSLIASRDDIIVLAYVLSSAKTNQLNFSLAGTGLERYGDGESVTYYHLP
ncbi:MAG: hypothetical protein IJ869_06510 [Clostridiales bacterium]|nr:hypothetical protein [Clostridiales bacterium]